MKYKEHTKINFVKLHLHLLRYTAEADELRAVLEALSKAIEASQRRMKEALGSKQEKYIEYVSDTESDLVENLLGAAFIVCQVQITSIAQRAIDARAEILKSACPEFNEFGDKKWGVMLKGEQFGRSSYSKVCVLNSLANYFKHRDEWEPKLDWTMLKSRGSRNTALVIEAAGLKPGSTGNLRNGAESLGLGGYHQLSILTDIIGSWAENILSVLESCSTDTSDEMAF